MSAPPGGGADDASAPVDLTGVDLTGVDLTGVDPVHWAETRERVAILRAWCANGRHPRAAAIAAADRMGVSVLHFYRLVAIWKKHRDARLVSGHPARRGDARPPKSMAAETRSVLRQVVAESGPEARFTDVLAAVRSACAAADARPPSLGMVHRELMRARQAGAAGPDAATVDVAVAVVFCQLPVAVADAVLATPALVLAVERPGGKILAHRLALDADAVGAARAVLTELAESPEREPSPIMVAADLGAAADEASATGQSSEGGRDGRIAVDSRLTLLSTTLGSYLDSIPILHRRPRRREPGPWKPLSTADAIVAVALAVATHNSDRRG